MNKSLRILLGFTFLVAIVAMGMYGTAWASKLQAGRSVLAPLPAATVTPRPDGTVSGDPHEPSDYSERRRLFLAGQGEPGEPGGEPTCTAVQTYCILDTQSGLTLTGITALPSGTTPLPAGYSVVPTRIQQITGTGTSTTEAVTFELNPALVPPEIVAYWNGTAWVQLTAAADGTYTIPAGAPLPLTIAVFTK